MHQPTACTTDKMQLELDFLHSFFV